MLTALSVVGAAKTSTAATPLEWSDIGYTQGRYSRIYFDYIQGGGTQDGKFYVINDWMVNRDDGGVNGGLTAAEYNLFTFNLGNNSYDIKIYGDGSSNISYTGPDSYGLKNFESATGWTTSPNDPLVDHTIWEFSFDVAPTTITEFVGCDPVVPTTTYIAPSAPSVITGLPSIYPHITDGAFSDVKLITLSPVPSRNLVLPLQDPLVHKMVVTLKVGGGAVPSPEPASMVLLGTGLAGFFGAKLRKKKQ